MQWIKKGKVCWNELRANIQDGDESAENEEDINVTEESGNVPYSEHPKWSCNFEELVEESCELCHTADIQFQLYNLKSQKRVISPDIPETKLLGLEELGLSVLGSPFP